MSGISETESTILIFIGDSPDRGSDCTESPQPSKVTCLFDTAQQF